MLSSAENPLLTSAFSGFWSCVVGTQLLSEKNHVNRLTIESQMNKNIWKPVASPKCLINKLADLIITSVPRLTSYHVREQYI